jgi:hypothetical protein
LTNTHGAVAQISPGVSSLSGTVGTSYATALQAIVRDQFGNSISGVKVTFTVVAGSNGAGGTVGGKLTFTATTAANGVARAPLTANTVAGTFTVSAAVSGVSTPASFNLTNQAAAAARPKVVAGAGQATAVNTLYATPLEVQVSDRFGNLVSGVQVTFAVQPNKSNGAGADFNGSKTAKVTTDASGNATALALTAGPKQGKFSVIASVAGAPAALFALEVTQP